MPYCVSSQHLWLPSLRPQAVTEGEWKWSAVSEGIRTHATIQRVCWFTGLHANYCINPNPPPCTSVIGEGEINCPMHPVVVHPTFWLQSNVYPGRTWSILTRLSLSTGSWSVDGGSRSSPSSSCSSYLEDQQVTSNLLLAFMICPSSDVIVKTDVILKYWKQLHCVVCVVHTHIE